MKLGKYNYFLLIFFSLFLIFPSLAEDKVSTSPLINLNELKPSFEEIEDTNSNILDNDVIKNKKKN